MNRAYRVIFNHSLGVWQCVSEIAKAKGKSKTLKTVVLAAAVAVSGQVSAADADYFLVQFLIISMIIS